MITKEDLLRKISSRKFWSLLIALVTSMLVAFNFSENQITQVVSVIGGFSSIVIYILAEASVDKKRLDSESK